MGQTPAWSLGSSFLYLGPLRYSSRGVKIYPGCTRITHHQALERLQGDPQRGCASGLEISLCFQSYPVSILPCFHSPPPCPPHGPPIHPTVYLSIHEFTVNSLLPQPSFFLSPWTLFLRNSFLNKRVSTGMFPVLCAESLCMAGDRCLLKLHLEHRGWGTGGYHSSFPGPMFSSLVL